jgi:hypothetical protein
MVLQASQIETADLLRRTKQAFQIEVVALLDRLLLVLQKKKIALLVVQIQVEH